MADRLNAREREALAAASRVTDLIARVTRRDPPPVPKEAPVTTIDFSQASLGAAADATVSSVQARARAVREMRHFFTTEPTVQDGLELLGMLAARPGRDGYCFDVQFPQPKIAGRFARKRARELRTIVLTTIDRRASLLDGGPGVCLRRKMPRMLTYALLEGQRHFEMCVEWHGLRSDITALEYIDGPCENRFLRRLVDPETKKLVGYGLLNLQTLRYERFFRPWQVMTLTWGDLKHDGTEPFGAIESARTQILRLRQMYEDMATARHDKAYSKFIHVYQGASDDDLMAKAVAMDRLRKKRGGGVLADLYTNGQIIPHDPANVQLSRTGDVEAVENQIMSVQKVPKGLRAGYGEQIVRATLDRQLEVTNYVCDNVCLMGTDGIERLIDLRLVLAGEDPAEWPYVVRWTPKEISTYSEKVGALALLAAGRVIGRRRVHLDLQLNPDEEEAFLEDQADLDTGLPEDRTATSELAAEDDAASIEEFLSRVDQIGASTNGHRKGALRALLAEALADAA